MQPYFLPYIGYFQLIGSVDVFVVYDNIKYTKKGWINRNRMLKNGQDAMFSLPLRKGSDFLDVRERELAVDFDRDKLLDQFKGAYANAPHFSATFPLLERIVRCQAQNLSQYVRHSIACVCGHLGLTTELRTSSDIAIRHELKSQEKVLALCQAIGADIYINAIGGTELYSKDEFRARGIELKFIRSRPIEYPQFGGEFVPWLSIVDVMMFNAPDAIRKYLSAAYELL